MQRIIDLFVGEPKKAFFLTALVIFGLVFEFWVIPELVATSIMADSTSLLAVLGGTQEHLADLFRIVFLGVTAFIFLSAAVK